MEALLNVADLMQTTDATVWAREFCLIVGEKIPGVRDHEDWIMGWFANAIMSGYDDAKRSEASWKH